VGPVHIHLVRIPGFIESGTHDRAAGVPLALGISDSDALGGVVGMACYSFRKLRVAGRGQNWENHHIQHICLLTKVGVTVDLPTLYQQLRVIIMSIIQICSVRMPTMSPSALHSGMSKKGECRHNAKVPMWQRLRPDVILCAAYYAFCGKISPQ